MSEHIAKSAQELFGGNGLARIQVDRNALTGMSGAAKALIFLVSLDESVATRILGHLDDDEMRCLRDSSQLTEEAPATAIKAVYHEFLGLVRDGLPASLRGSHAYLRRLAGNALGEGRAAELFSDTVAETRGLAQLPTPVIGALLAEEQPQTIAVVVSQLPPAKASEVVEQMDPALRDDVMLRLACLEGISETVLADIENTFQVQVDNLRTSNKRDIAGKKVAADIVKRLPKEVGDALLEALRDTNAPAAEAVEKALFTFEDLMRIDSRGMQQLLKEVATDKLTIALKTASDELKEKVFGNISSRAADMLHEELELMGPVRLADVEEAQGAIIASALELERDGRITIAREGGGDFV